MKFTIDTHTHTLVSGHAYNTIDEMAAFAAEKGVITSCYNSDHAPKCQEVQVFFIFQIWE